MPARTHERMMGTRGEGKEGKATYLNMCAGARELLLNTPCSMSFSVKV